MPRFKTRRQARYYELVHRYHFLPSEATELSRIKKYPPPDGKGSPQYPPAMLALQRSKLAAWANYKQWVGRQAWLELTDREIWEGWRNRVYRFYDRQRIKHKKDKDTGLSIDVLTRWIVRKDVHGRRIKPKPSVWEWYDDIFQKLPDELKWDSPGSKRTTQPEVKVDKIRIRRWVEDLKKAVERTADRRQRAQFREQIRNLERSLKR